MNAVAISRKHLLPGTYDAGARDVVKDAQRLALLVLAISVKWLRTSGITAGIPVAAPLHHMDERLMHPEDRGTRWRRVMQAD